MLSRRKVARAVPLISQRSSRWRRGVVTLAIETSCDDTCVAVLEKHHQRDPEIREGDDIPALKIHHHERTTADNLEFKGIHPLTALQSHQENLASLTKSAIASQRAKRPQPWKPDFITVTRGPGMRAGLFTGLDHAKGLAVAFQVPLVAVNHMQAHALTPRLVSALSQSPCRPLSPKFPFLSLLVSGGHSMLLHSRSLNDHETLASTIDIAIGDAIDKIARSLLPATALQSSKTVSYGPLLENFAFPKGAADYPENSNEAVSRVFGHPLIGGGPKSKSKAMQYSFSGLSSYVDKLSRDGLGSDEARHLAIDAMRVAFEHLASRVVLGLKNMEVEDPECFAQVGTLVVSGGVAANKYLRDVCVGQHL